MTLIPEDLYEDFEAYVDLDDLQTYKECPECGTYNLVEDHFCGYCCADFCDDVAGCTQCTLVWAGTGFPEDFAVY